MVQKLPRTVKRKNVHTLVPSCLIYRRIIRKESQESEGTLLNHPETL